MICPFCGEDNDKVIDSRASDGGLVIRRRRACHGCDRRYTTYERIEHTSRLVVVKKDGSRVPFDRENVLRGIQAACGKRPVPEDTKEEICRRIEDEVHRESDREVASEEIGKRVALLLREVDPIVYIRFASEHYEFRTLEEFDRELTNLKARPRRLKNEQDLF